MKILLINPNTTQSITDLVLTEARKLAPADIELKAVTARFGGRYIASRTTYAIAAHAALDAYAEHGTGGDADVIVLACFGDPALAALKEIAPQPVTGMAEAACLSAAAHDGRFAIVTGGERWGPMLTEFVASIGLADKLAGVKTVAPSGAEIARDPDRALTLLADACQACVTELGASTIILGGAGLAGIAPRIASRVSVPLIDGLAAAIDKAITLGRVASTSQDAAQPGGPSRAPASSSDAIATVGLSPDLSRLLSGA